MKTEEERRRAEKYSFVTMLVTMAFVVPAAFIIAAGSLGPRFGLQLAEVWRQRMFGAVAICSVIVYLALCLTGLKMGVGILEALLGHYPLLVVAMVCSEGKMMNILTFVCLGWGLILIAIALIEQRGSRKTADEQ